MLDWYLACVVFDYKLNWTFVLRIKYVMASTLAWQDRGLGFESLSKSYRFVH